MLSGWQAYDVVVEEVAYKDLVLVCWDIGGPDDLRPFVPPTSDPSRYMRIVLLANPRGRSNTSAEDACVSLTCACRLRIGYTPPHTHIHTPHMCVCVCVCRLRIGYSIFVLDMSYRVSGVSELGVTPTSCAG